MKVEKVLSIEGNLVVEVFQNKNIIVYEFHSTCEESYTLYFVNKSNDVLTDASSTTKYPNVRAVKAYVDNQIAQGTIPDATATVYGKVRLGGDLAGTGSTAGTPIISDNSITSTKIADLAVTNGKIVGIDGTKVAGSIPGNAANVNGIITTSHGGTGALATLNGYVKGNGASAMTSSTTIPVADVIGAELSSNKSIAGDLGNTSTRA